MANQKERAFTGIWIPKHIWLNDDLSPIEKLFLAEIESLSNDEKRGCFASNEYFGNFFKISEGRAANIISALRKRGYINQVFFDGKVRGIRLHENVKAGFTTGGARLHENVKAGFTKRGRLVSRKREPYNIVDNIVDNKEENAGASDPLCHPYKKVGDIYPERFSLEANEKKKTTSQGAGGSEAPGGQTMGAVRLTLVDPDLPGVRIEDEVKLKTKPAKPGRASKTQEEIEIAGRVVEYLNKAAGRNFRTNTGENAKGIIAQARQGYTEAQMCKVIDFKIRQWGNDAQMREHLNPVTLFRPANFERYLNAAELPPIKEHPKDQQPTGQPAKIRQL